MISPSLVKAQRGRPKPVPILKFFSYLYPKDKLPITIQTSDGYVEKFAHPTESKEPLKESRTKTTYATADSSPKVESYSYKLSDLAWTRSGDKGDTCNIGVIAKDKAQYPLLLEALTAEKVASYFAHKFSTDKPSCIRYEVPGVYGLNFVLENSQGGGGIASLNPDPQGKGYAQMLLDIQLKK